MGAEATPFLELGKALANSESHPVMATVRRSSEPTLESAASNFRMLCSSACSLAGRQLFVHMQNPHQMFCGAHWHPWIAKEAMSMIEGQCECVRGPVGQRLVEQKLPQSLELPARLMGFQMEEIEALHGWVRRKCSQQGEFPVAETLASNFRLVQHSWRVERLLPSVSPSDGGAELKEEEGLEEDEGAALQKLMEGMHLQPDGKKKIGTYKTFLHLESICLSDAVGLNKKYQMVLREDGPYLAQIKRVAHTIDQVGGLENYKLLCDVRKGRAARDKGVHIPVVDEQASSLPELTLAAKRQVMARTREHRIEEQRLSEAAGQYANGRSGLWLHCHATNARQRRRP